MRQQSHQATADERFSRRQDANREKQTRNYDTSSHRRTAVNRAVCIKQIPYRSLHLSPL